MFSMVAIHSRAGVRETGGALNMSDSFNSCWSGSLSVVKYKILREGELFQRGSINIDLIFYDIFFVKPAQVDQSAYWHIRIKGTLMFVQVHHAADEE